MNERRRFLKVISAAAAASAVGAACGDDETDGGPGVTQGIGGAGGNGGGANTAGAGGIVKPPPINAGNVVDFVEGELVGVTNRSLYVGRDSSGIYAMTSLCTHRTCDMLERGAILADRIHCDCHDSEFDYNGAVLMGPATSPLRHYQVTIEPDGTVMVDTTEPVDASVRVAAP